MRVYYIAIIVGLTLLCQAQDTIKVMHYNLLNYGNTTSYCTPTNNNFSDKDGYLRTINNYIRPDIFTVNEIGGNTYVIQRLLDSTLNINGINYYQRADYTNTNGSNIVSMLYYDASKFVLHSQDVVTTDVRDILIYKLYYRSDDLGSGDTAFIIPIVTHLKAGYSGSDQALRDAMTGKLMNYLDSINVADNYILCGDLNVKSSTEQSYQNLINYSNAAVRFYDPINEPGNWNNSSSFAAYHTQSTHSSSNGCASSGGMDDRFDFILTSNNIINGLDHYEYITDSYWAFGNDGQHFNKSINVSPTNSSVPANVLNALYNMSDHLPVVMDLEVDKTLSSIKIIDHSFADIRINNPVKETLNLTVTLHKQSSLKIEIFSVHGQLIFEKAVTPASNQFNFSIPINDLKSSIYLVKITGRNNNPVVFKFLKD